MIEGCRHLRLACRRFTMRSDVHGNLPALEAVLAEAKSMGVSRVVVLGDVVGYRPFPQECLRALSGAELCLQGNHEAGVLGR